MARLSRAETQERTRRAVLAAARDEFGQRGFRDAKVDSIAARAELTRGAVYSNFPGKRALYFAVLADDAELRPVPPHAQPGSTTTEALGALARAWVSDLPRAADFLSEVSADERTRAAFAELLRLDALLLGLALERLDPPAAVAGLPPRRLVRLAGLVLTTLHGAGQLGAAAPGFTEPFDVISACEQLAGLVLNDWWSPPPVTPDAERDTAAWQAIPAADLVTGRDAVPAGDGVLAFLGTRRVAAAEELVRAAPEGTDVTAVLAIDDPELAPLTRLVLAELCGCLRQAFPARAWPPLQVVLDERGALAAAAGVRDLTESTEAAIRVEAGRIVSRARGAGAAHAVASASARV